MSTPTSLRPWWRYLSFLPLGLVLATLGYGLAFYTQLGVPVYSAGSVAHFHTFKLAAAQAAPSPKILILSGSNGHFGLSAQQIQEATGRPTVNLAVFAGLTTDYLWWDLQQVAHSGDIVIMPLEYTYYQGDKFSGVLFQDFIIGHDAAYVRQLSWIQQIKLILETKPGRILLGHLSRWAPGLLLPPESFLRHLNAQGDEVLNQPSDQTPVYRAFVEKEKVFALDEYKLDSWRSLETLTDWCHRHQITLLITYPSLLQNPAYSESAYQDFFRSIRDFWARQQVPVLGTPEQFMYPVDDFFDTAMHLNTPARTRRTATVLQWLQPYLAPHPGPGGEAHFPR